MTETSQYYVLIVAEMSKKWFDALPPDLQKIIMTEADVAARGIVPWRRRTWQIRRRRGRPMVAN